MIFSAIIVDKGVSFALSSIISHVFKSLPLENALNTINSKLNTKVEELQISIATGNSSLDEKITTKYNELIVKINDEFSSNQIKNQLYISA